jgi:hypothetical protein
VKDVALKDNGDNLWSDNGDGVFVGLYWMIHVYG